MPVTKTLPEVAGANFASLGANWRLQFIQPDGIPLTMTGLEVIDFGAISYKEVFQNVKTILATPLFTAALERTLGLDNTIVDRPINDAAAVTVAILTAVNAWEPRCQVMNISFEADAINGHLVVLLQLDIRNVIYGSNKPYAATAIFPPPLTVVQGLPPSQPAPPGPVGPIGPAGPQGQRGSYWFTGTTAPKAGPLKPMAVPGSQGPQGPAGPQGQRGFVWLQGAGAPVTPQDLDMYLNTSNGDVWQYDQSTQTWRRTTMGSQR
jgi:phage baseplate assembly protein W